MKAIIQHNFNTGFGDGLFAITDYLVNATSLKKLGYQIKLQFNLRGNLYFKDKIPTDYLDITNFSCFDEIEVVSSPLSKVQDDVYTCVYTHAHAKPSQHYWDLFIDNESLNFFNENYTIINYNLVGMINGNIPPQYPILNKDILNMYKNFVEQNLLSNFDSIYFRTQDLDEELDFLNKNKEDLQEVLNTDKKVFICSNSKEFKKYIKSLGLSNVYFWEIPLEDEWGGNHLLHQKLDSNNLHLRTIYTLLDMWTLCNSKTINFYTTWGRYSNFLFYAPINNCKIIYK